MRSNLKRPHQASISDYENEEHNLNRYAYGLEEKAKIVNWLKTTFTSIQLPNSFNLEMEPVIYFRDG